MRCFRLAAENVRKSGRRNKNEASREQSSSLFVWLRRGTTLKASLVVDS